MKKAWFIVASLLSIFILAGCSNSSQKDNFLSEYNIPSEGMSKINKYISASDKVANSITNYIDHDGSIDSVVSAFKSWEKLSENTMKFDPENSKNLFVYSSEDDDFDEDDKPTGLGADQAIYINNMFYAGASAIVEQYSSKDSKAIIKKMTAKSQLTKVIKKYKSNVDAQ